MTVYKVFNRHHQGTFFKLLADSDGKKTIIEGSTSLTCLSFIFAGRPFYHRLILARAA